MNNEPLVSIIIPSYKRHRTIFARAIESLLSQTYENIEIVLVDDNAKPELKEFRVELEAYVKELNSDKILYIQNDGNNAGSAGARNVGIYKARGEVISFLDDDDYYLSDKIKNQVEHLLTNDLDANFTNIKVLNENNEIVDFREFRRIKSFDNKYLLEYHLTRKITPTNIYMIKKECLLDVNSFDTNGMGDELILMTKLIKSNIRIGYLDDAQVILCRFGQNSLTLDVSRLEYEKRVFEYIKQHFNQMSFAGRCYARFRYNVMKMVTYKRAKRYGKMLGSLICAFFSHPIAFFVEPIRMRRNLKENV